MNRILGFRSERRSRVFWLLALLFLVVGSSGCRKIQSRLADRSCVTSSGCLADYRCHPLKNICVPRVDLGCSEAGDLCPAAINTGDVCTVEAAVLPCDLRFVDCERGCRDCVEGSWTACTQPQCTTGGLEHCDFCGNDCRAQVLNAEAQCVARGDGGFACSYQGECRGQAVDANRDATDGCECLPSEVERCAGGDNGCSTGSCAAGSFCDAGQCVPCACPAMFSQCTDVAGDFSCSCNDATSCENGLGACEDDGATCVFSDDFNGTLAQFALLSPCPRDIPDPLPDPPLIPVWELGQGSHCTVASSCWATQLDGPYFDAREECIRSRTFDLSGVAGPVTLELALYYDYEWSRENNLWQAFDGASLFFHRPGVADSMVFVAPDSDWDTDLINIDTPRWPGWDQTRRQSGLSTTVSPLFTLDRGVPEHRPLFTRGFAFQIWHLSDNFTQADGIYVDDVLLKVRR